MNPVPTMACPKCRKELETTDLHGVPAARCPGCAGLWISDAGLQLAKDHADPDVGWLELELWSEDERIAVASHEHPCPACGKPLYTVGYRGTDVTVEHCDACQGVWLEAGHFERIVAALEAEVAAMPASELLAATVREAADLVRGDKPLAEEWADVKHVLSLLKLRVLTDNPGLRKALLELQRSTPFG